MDENIMDEETSWREQIEDEMRANKESFDDVVSSTLSDDELDVKFYGGFGGAEGEPFTLWTKKFVYFPVVYDGAEWVGSVPRDPCGKKKRHVGGGN